MNDAVTVMLQRYACSSTSDYENALKEIIQELALLGLWRSKFFEKAAFYGGSALRILYGLERFSQDLDFSLLQPDPHFSLTDYCTAIEEELKGFGFSVSVEKKIKTVTTTIESAFIKAGTLQNLILVQAPASARRKIASGKLLKVKLEVDKDPPGNFTTEAKYLFQPIPFSVITLTQADLFAGKMHAILCRAWHNRVKGRDWYDLVWFVSRKTPVGLKHLESRMKQTGHLTTDALLTEDMLKQKFRDRIASVDFNLARQDVENLVKDRSTLALWSRDFFNVICEQIRAI